MNIGVQINVIVQTIAILKTCIIECSFVNKNAEHRAFVTHFEDNFKNTQVKSVAITNPAFDPGGTRVTEEHLEDLRKVYLFNVAHKLKEGRKLLDLYTVPLNKQELALEHFNSYFSGGYTPKAKHLEEIKIGFESNKYEIKEAVRRIQDVFLSEILEKYGYVDNMSDREALARQVDLMYSADLMASYILLFTKKILRSVLYKHIWTNFAFLDSNKQYLCCNWIVNGGKHDLELHKKFSLEELTNEDLVNIIRLHKNYLSFVKSRSRKVLNKLDRSSLISIFQTILMRSIWAHYVHEPSNLSVDNPKIDEDQERESEEYVNVIEPEGVEEEEPMKEGYLDNIYEWMIRYRNKLSKSGNVRGMNYLNSEEFKKLKTTLTSLENLYAEMAPKPKCLSTKSGRRKIVTDEDAKRKQLRQSLKALIQYYRDNLTMMGAIYGRISERENVKFINNLMDYDKNHIFNLLVVFLSAIPELKQIRSRQMYLNYMSLSKVTLVKLLYIALIRSNPTFVPLINHSCTYDLDFLTDEEAEKVDQKMMEERKEIIAKNNFTLYKPVIEEEKNDSIDMISFASDDKEDSMDMGSATVGDAGMKDKGESSDVDSEKRMTREDVLIFELDELEGMIDVNAKVNKDMKRKWASINKETKQVVTLGTNRTSEVIISILNHPPHHKILLKLLNENDYNNEIIKNNIEYLNRYASNNDGSRIEFGRESESSGSNEEKNEEEAEFFLGPELKENIEKIIRDKKVEVILRLMKEDELKKLYNQFLQYIYPFNTMNESKEYKKYLVNHEIEDEDIEVESGNDIIGNLIGEVDESRIDQAIEIYAKSIENQQKTPIGESILSYLSNTMDMEKEDDLNKFMKLSEKNDIELIEEANERVKTLEEDENTLRIRLDSCKPFGGRSSVFKVLSTERKNKDYRNMKLGSMNDDDIKYFDDYLDGPSSDEEDGNDDVEDEGSSYSYEGNNNNANGIDKWRKKGVEFNNEDEAFEVNNVIIKRNKEASRTISSHIFDDKPLERGDRLEFGEDMVQNWTKLGLNMNIASAGVSYLTRLYSKPRGHSSSNDGNVVTNVGGLSNICDLKDVDGVNGPGDMDIRESLGSISELDRINKLEPLNLVDRISEIKSISIKKKEIVELPIRPSLIQMLSIPEMLKKEKNNVIICGSVGSGKTLSYLLPIMQTLKEHEKRKLREPSSPRCLILTPTSELCDQIGTVVKELSHMVKMSSTTISKDCTAKVVKSKLKGLIDVVVAMPSKLMKYRDYFKLSHLKYLVIEEADCMLNEGFFPQVYSILQQIPNYSHITRGKNSVDRRKQVQIVQVASNIAYLKFFESIQTSFNKFLRRNSLIEAKKEDKNKAKNKENDEEESGSKENLFKSKNVNEDEEYIVNLRKLFGKHKKRLELYKHILDYYFSPLNKRKNETFVYNRRIIDDIVESNKVVDEIGITRPSKGIRHMFIPSNNEKVRTLINTLKYDLKYVNCTGNEVKNGVSLSVKDMGGEGVEQRDEGDEDRKIIIFCRKVKAVIAIDYYLNEAGFKPISIHSEMPFKMRRNNFNKYKSSKSAILITTELMSRGLNMDVDVVINFDFPLNPNEYIRKSSLLVHTPLVANGYPPQYSTGASDMPEYGPVKIRPKICIGLIDKKDRVLSEAIKRSLVVDYFPVNKLSSRRNDYNHLTGRLKYLTQAGCYFKFLSYLRGLKIEGTFDPAHMHKYLDAFREIVKNQFINSFKKVKLRRIRICKRRRELMRELKMMKRWNKAIRLKQRIISDLDRKKREKDYIYVGLTKDQRSCPPLKNLKKVRYELLKLKLLKGSNSEKLLKRSQNQIYKFINRLQMKLVDRNHLMDKLRGQFGSTTLLDSVQASSKELSVFEQVKGKLELIRGEDRNRNVRRICSLI